MVVLIRGEAGTGKELLARTIHNISVRRKRPFVKVDFIELPEEEIEIELFGREERGTFSGALFLLIGRFELVDGGTIFLDEVAAYR